MAEIITEKLLKIGFVKTENDKVYSIRIHDKIYLEYDFNDGFLMLVRILEHAKHGEDRVKITIPKKPKSFFDIVDLLNMLE